METPRSTVFDLAKTIFSLLIWYHNLSFLLK